ncbi:MAG: 16S rRNA (cytosine(1402)-N(4))-methyltransferase RsmH [Thermoanaerobaculia bacterium]|nr:16S rRNA (cytosine(1402)-N(4))-methyltransferase RsmH [Thermoanaerobaculia bacterium]
METAGMPTHAPVLVREVLDLLAPALAGGGWTVDTTLGLGGHAAAVLDRFPSVRLFGLDRDPRALQIAAQRLAPFGERVLLERGRFSDLTDRLDRHGIRRVRGLLADLGVSSMQLDIPSRGFSFQANAPLDMRMGAAAVDRSEPTFLSAEAESLLARAKALDIEPDEPTAHDIVNRYPEEELANIFKQYGEERHARRIARGIAEARREQPVETTGELAKLVAEWKPVPPRHGGRRPGQRNLHPATQVFQALRMEVNREMDELESLLDQAVTLLEKEGCLAIISYHSGEDRAVKHTLRDLATGQIDRVTGRPRAETQVIEVLTKKPVRPTDAEVAQNPRSRSARLRAARRI